MFATIAGLLCGVFSADERCIRTPCNAHGDDRIDVLHCYRTACTELVYRCYTHTIHAICLVSYMQNAENTNQL